MFEKILYPTDFSDISHKALSYVKDLGESGTREVVLVHVIDHREFEHFYDNVSWGGQLPADLIQELQDKRMEDARKYLGDIAEELHASGLEVRQVIEMGNPLTKILEIGVKEAVSAIVLGSHGKSNLAEILLGSVSENIVRRSDIPVLVVKR